MNVAIDEAWHEKSSSRINLPASSDWRTANGPDSVTRNSDIVRSLKYDRTVEDSRVVYYEVARITVVGLHLWTLRYTPRRNLRYDFPIPTRSNRSNGFPRQGVYLKGSLTRLPGFKDKMNFAFANVCQIEELFSNTRGQPDDATGA
jgi:hypothetical protein